jgi:LysM repeat protein
MNQGRHARQPRPGMARTAIATGAVFAASGPIFALAAPAQANDSGPIPAPVAATSQPVVVKAAVTATVKPVKPRTYDVKAGDTLTSIARKIYGDHVNWLAFWQANAHRVHNPNFILPGQQLLTPAVLPTHITVKVRPPVAPVVLRAAVSHAALRTPVTHPVAHAVAAEPVAHGTGVLTAAQVGAYWLEAGGPAADEAEAEAVAYCESGYNTAAYNPSGATGLWQILGAVLSGNLDDPLTNARNAVAKFEASGDTWAQWVCKP